MDDGPGSTDVARAALDGATRALAPFAEDGARAALRWAAVRWPDFVRETVLPTLQEAVGADDRTAEPERRGPVYVAAAGLAAAVAAAAWRRR